MSHDTYPLDGIRVVAIEQAIAVPLATRHLADLGAEVIKIERPGAGDMARGYDSLADGVSVHFAWTNRGKRSVAIDLKSEEGRARAAELIAQSDVFVSNLGPGALDRLGLGPRAMQERAPGVVCVELTGYGEDGPMAARKAYDLLVQSEIGAAQVSGTSDEPAKVGISIVDISGAMYVLSSVLAALLERQQTGRGRAIRLSLFDCIAEWMSVPLLQARYQGFFERSGRFHNAIYPYGPFPCRDGEIVLAVQNDAEWQRLSTLVLQDAALASDPRFTRNELRHRNRDSLGRILSDRFATMDVADLISRLGASDVPFAEGRTVEQAVAHPEFLERGRWAEFATEAGRVSLLRSPFDADGGWPTPQGGVPPLRGEADD